MSRSWIFFLFLLLPSGFNCRFNCCTKNTFFLILYYWKFENLGQEINFVFLTVILKVVDWVSGKAGSIGKTERYMGSIKNTAKVKHVFVLWKNNFLYWFKAVSILWMLFVNKENIKNISPPPELPLKHYTQVTVIFFIRTLHFKSDSYSLYGECQNTEFFLLQFFSYLYCNGVCKKTIFLMEKWGLGRHNYSTFKQSDFFMVVSVCKD